MGADPDSNPVNQKSPAQRLLPLISSLLTLVLLGAGYYLVTLSQTSNLFGISSAIWFGVGQSVIASALVSFLMLANNWAERVATGEKRDQIVETLEGYNAAITLLKRTGIRAVHKDRYIRPIYQQHQALVSRQLDILGMSLKHFQQDIGTELTRWVGDRPDLWIRVMVLNPSLSYCKSRDKEEGTPEGEISEGALRITETVLKAANPRIGIRWYNTLPTVSMYRLDDVLFFGAYFVDRLSRLTATLEVDVRSELAEQYLKHFESLWDPPLEHSSWSMVPTSLDVERVRRLLKGNS